MNHTAILAIARRDLTVMVRNKAVIAPAILVPALLVTMTAVGTWLVSRSGDTLVQAQAVLDQIPEGLLAGDASMPLEVRLALVTATYLVPPILIVVPLLVVSLLATDAVAGERERGTIEGVMLSPITERELMVGKVAGPLAVGLTVGLLAHLIYAVVVNIVLWPRLDGLALPTGNWLVTVLWFGPAFTVLALAAVVLVSARARTVQSAYQISGALVLPLVLLTLGQATGVVLLKPWIGLVSGAVLLGLSVVLTVVGSSWLSRERQLTSLP